MSSNSKKTIILIGGAGYIGTVIANYFLNLNFNVIVYDNLIYNHDFALKDLKKNKNFKFITGDIRSPNQLLKNLEFVDYAVLLAGLVGDPITKIYPKLSVEINLNGIKNCLNIINESKVKRVIFVSTCSNYGLIPENKSADEEYILNPLSLYAKNKVECEEYISSLKDKVNYSATILRFATAFGLSPRMRFDLTVNEFTYYIFNQKELVVYDKDTWRPYCHVDDFALLIKKVLSAKEKDIYFQTFNAGSDENNATKQMILELISKQFKNKANILFEGDGRDRRNYKVDFSKVRKTLDFKCNVSIEEGIVKIIESMKSGNYFNFERNKEKFGNYKII